MSENDPTTLDEARAQFAVPALEPEPPSEPEMCYCGTYIEDHGGAEGCNDPRPMPSPYESAVKKVAAVIKPHEGATWTDPETGEIVCRCPSGLIVEVKPLRLREEQMLTDKRFADPMEAIANVFDQRCRILDPGPAYSETYGNGQGFDWMDLIKSDFETIATVMKEIS